MRRILFPFVLALAWPVTAAELPVREVILYKHGIGFFERAGRLEANETARLEFRASEMNDVLKSLTIEEKGGGKVSGLRYDSSVPLEKKLADYPFRIADGQPLSAVLDQLRGARIELQFGSEKAAGAIVAARVVAAGKDAPEREQITLLLDSGDLRNFDLAAATNIRFTETKLQSQFKDYLVAVAGARSVDRKSVYVHSTDDKAHDVVASYVIPSPMWKSSYRLVFGATGAPVLEGWAIVDNTTGEDWNSVRMSLVSGKPISFISALYEPRYVARLSAELAEDKAIAPTVYSGAMEMRKTVTGNLNGGMAGGIIGGMPSAAPPAPEVSQFARLGKDSMSSTVTVSSGQDVGDLFEYRITDPVTVHQNESAMLPFLQQKIDARKLLIYSDRSSQHPLQAAELTNSTGKTLDGGPITVFDGGAYAGEALVETLKNADKRLISYAVDLGTRITTNFETKNAIVREAHLVRGVLTTRTAAEETVTYSIRNVDAKAKTLIVEHPVRPQYELLAPKAAETSPTAYRFEIALAANGTAKLPVSEERVYNTTLALSNATPDVLMTYVQNKNLSAAARQALQQIADAKRKIADLDAQVHGFGANIDNLNHDQERLRQNITTLNNVSGQQQQVQSYAGKMAAQETELASLETKRRDAQQQKEAAQNALNTLIAGLEF